MNVLDLHTLQNKKVKLNTDNEIHRGGEGRIIALPADKGRVAKIYHQGIEPMTMAQFNFLSQLNKDLFVVPQELLLYANDVVAGFIMEYLGNDYFPLSTIFSKTFCARSGITAAFKTEVARRIIEGLQYAHQMKIIIGDLNQYNILITLHGDVKFIDTDSYETPAHQHTGYLLDDIRDYLHGGDVCRNSDYFALSVLIFYAATYTHPFKGIHSKYKTLAERMINRLPVFLTTPDIKQPKCYTPITDHVLQRQFERKYINGERFLLSLDGLQSISTRISRLPSVRKVVEDKLVITTIVSKTNVRDIFFHANIGYIMTDDNYLIFDASNKGYMSKIRDIARRDFAEVYLGYKNMIGLNNRALYLLGKNNDSSKITNFEMPSDAIIQQYGNMLLIVGSDVMYWLYLDEVLNQSVKIERQEVFGRSFHLRNGLIHNAGGVPRIYYKTTKSLAVVKLNVNVKMVYQQENVGIVQYVENNTVVNRYFKITGLTATLLHRQCEQFVDFAFMPTSIDEGFIFEPDGGKINVVRTQDFVAVSEISCDLVSEHSKLQHTKSGIVLWSENSVFLLNMK